MRRVLCLAGAATMLGLAALATSDAGADNAKTPTVKEIMGALTKGPNSAFGQTKKALGSEPPDWKAAKAAAATIRVCAPSMLKNEPPKGDKAAWGPKAEAFCKDSLALADAVEKEDLAAANAAQGRLGMSCMACHREHRPMPKGAR